MSLRWTFASSVCACTDLGTESGFGSTVDVDFADVFRPHCGSFGGIVDDGDSAEFDRESSVPSGVLFSHLMPFGLISLGNLHILDTTMHKITEALPFWDWFKPLLKSLSHFLHDPDSRRRLQAKCCSNDRGAFFTKQFDTAGCPKLIEHRWEVVARCARGCLKHRLALQAVWDLTLYGQSEGSAKSDGAELSLLSVSFVCGPVGLSYF